MERGGSFKVKKEDEGHVMNKETRGNKEGR